ncbi:MAG: serine/threonine protein kinase [Actinomycetota bacterium]|nr:serine/threonine protein kinase [Actinomycetota bacterium]
MPHTTERQVAGRYVLRDQLGKGGMGTVWRATDNVLKRQVAIKEVKLPPALSEDDSSAMKNRVMREAQTAGRLSHPNAVTVFDVVEEGGTTFIVMELVDAPSLDDLVKTQGALAPERVASIGRDVLDALEAAHGYGITHRDVKPGNVMITPEGRAKLADFGIASVKGDPRLTATGLLLGSPSFMAPEQASQDTSGPESDLWALGATLYYAVEGEAPFDRGAAIPTLTAVVHDEPRPMTRAGALAPVIAALLSKNPADRPEAARLRTLLQQVASGTETDTAPDTRAATAVAAAAAATMVDERSGATRPRPQPQRIHSRPAPRTDPRSDSRPWFAWLAALVVLGLLAAFLIPKLGGGDDATEEPAGQGRRGGAAAGAREPAEDTAEEVAAPADEADDAAPADPPAEATTTYEDPAVGYQISYPSGWDVVPLDTRTDFKEAGTGRYLRIDYTETPGPDAYDQIEQSGEPSFASRHPDYERVQLTETTFAGTDNAALWEYTYEGQHAYNLQFVTADGEYGFALNFQTPEDQWDESQDLWESFKASFVLP